jgi:hypothetical protein
MPSPVGTITVLGKLKKMMNQFVAQDSNASGDKEGEGELSA